MSLVTLILLLYIKGHNC